MEEITDNKKVDTLKAELVNKGLITEDMDTKDNISIIQALKSNLKVLPIPTSVHGVIDGTVFMHHRVGDENSLVELIIPNKLIEDSSYTGTEDFVSAINNALLTDFVKVTPLAEGYENYFKSVFSVLPNTVLDAIPELVKQTKLSMEESKAKIVATKVMQLVLELNAVNKPVYSVADVHTLTGVSIYKINQIIKEYKANLAH